MITIEESGLSGSDYALLKAARTDAIWEVIAHRTELAFTSTFGTGNNDDGYFDTLVYNNVLYRITDLSFQSFDGADWQNVSGYTLPAAGATDVGLASDASGIAVFALNSEGIHKSYYDLTNWTSWEVVTSDVPYFMRSVTPDRVHYVVYDPSTSLLEFKTAVFSASWSAASSGIFWQFPITSFDALALADRDVIVVATNTPGAVKTSWANNQITKRIMPSGGLVAFTYRNGSWSDHYEIDIQTEVSAWRSRLAGRLSLVDGKACLIAYSTDGTQGHILFSQRIYFSTDGRAWSRGEVLPITAHSYGIQLWRVGNYAYAVSYGRVYRSDATLLVGHSAPACQLNISRYIKNFTVNWQDMQQVFLVLTNAGNWLGNSLLNGDHSITLVVRAGYWCDTPRRKLMVQTGLLRVDSIEKSHNVPTREVAITARDLLVNLYDYSKSEVYKVWEPMLIGADDFTDYTGMRHTDTGSGTGAWKVGGNALKLTTNNEEGLVFSLFASEELWNGQDQISFTLAKNSNDEFAGIIFHGQDKDNLDFVRYEQTADKIRYYRRRAGLNTLISESSILSWTAAGIERWLRIHWHYGKVYAFSSADGKTWTLRLTANGVGQPSLLTHIYPQGRVGQIGKGFSDEDQWSVDPGPLPNPTAPPLLPDPNGLHEGTDNIVAVIRPNYSGTGFSDWIQGYYRTSNFRAPIGVQTWEFVDLSAQLGTPENDSIMDILVDPYSPKYITGTGTVNGWLWAYSGIYRITDLFGTPVLSSHWFFPDGINWDGHTRFHTHIASQNFLVFKSDFSGLGKIYVSVDGGANWVVNGAGLRSSDNEFLAVSAHTPTTFFISDPDPFDNSTTIYKTTNGGESYVVLLTTAADTYDIGPWIPYPNNPNDSIFYYYGGGPSGAGYYQYNNGTFTKLTGAGIGGFTMLCLDFSATNRNIMRGLSNTTTPAALNYTKNNNAGFGDWDVTQITFPDYSSRHLYATFLAVAGDNANVIFAAGIQGVMAVSYNDGLTWYEKSILAIRDTERAVVRLIGG